MDCTRIAARGSALAALALLLAGTARAEPRWLLSTDARQPWRVALDRAKRAREPIMAFVCVEGQQLTAMMVRQTFGDLAVDGVLGDFLCVKVDAVSDDNQPFLDAYDVGRRDLQVEPGYEGNRAVENPGRAQTYPVTIFLNPDGGLEHMVYGFVIPEDFLQVLQQVQGIMAARERLDKQADDARALAELGGLYVSLQRYAVGRQTLEAALAADPDGKQGVGETALLDLAVAWLAGGEGQQAIELITRHLGEYPDSELGCKAHFLLGGALLALVEPDRLAAEELTAQGKTAEAADAAARLRVGRREAEEAWSWFEGEKGKVPCEGMEWAEYSLGALAELRAEMAYAELLTEVDALLAEGKLEAAVQRLRLFGTDEKQGHRGTDRGCEALFRAGEELMKGGKKEEALAQWRKLAELDPEQNPCAQTLWRAQALGRLQAP
jgi:tetratricopeptide (TPR) repeat protein